MTKPIDHSDDILVVRNDRLGDMLLALPTIPFLRSLYPSKKIHFWANPANADIIQYVDGIDQVILAPVSWTPSIIERLRQLKIGTAYCLRATHANARALKRAKIPVRIGTTRRWYSWQFTHRINLSRRKSNLHEAELNLLMVDRNINTSEAVFPSLTIPKDASDSVSKLLYDRHIEPDERIVIIHPGSGGSAREWHVGYFRELGNMIAHSCGIKVVVTGGINETEKCRKAAGDTHINLSGRTNLLELTALLLRSDLIVTNSTGPLHLAVALGKKALGLYPPVKDCLPARWGPFRHQEWAMVPELPLCKRCTDGRISSCACMETLTPQMVFNKAIDILDK